MAERSRWTVEETHDWTTILPSTAVVHTIAEQEECGLTDLDVQLYDTLDPEALDMLVRSGNGTLSFSFVIDNRYHVTIDESSLMVGTSQLT